MNKRIAISFVISFVILTIYGCLGEIGEKTNVYVDNYFGGKNMYFTWFEENAASGIEINRVGYIVGDNKYIKLNDSIYQINDNKLELLIKSDYYIQSIVAAGNEYVLYTTRQYVDSRVSKIKLNIYYPDSELSEKLIETSNLSIHAFLGEDDFWIEENEDRFTIGDESYYIITNEDNSYEKIEITIPDKLPEEYYIKQVPGETDNDYIVCTTDNNGDELNIGMTKWYQTSTGYVNLKEIKTSHTHRSVAFKNIITDDCMIYQHVEFEGSNPADGMLATAYYCPTNVWNEDVLEKYDFNTCSSEDFYKDSENRIIGYDYDNNIVYLYSFSKNAIEAKDLDDNSVTTLSSLEKAQTIKFTWCDRTLFWIYENDEVESYGGYLDL